jgi:4'-phosphopantetheinyl transferase
VSNFPAAPASYTVGPGEAHVWRVPLASIHADTRQLRGLLSPSECARADRFALERDAARFISCRANLRVLLARYTGVPPERLVLRYEPYGKPSLAGATGWQFNVSHSRDLAAIAIARYDAVGVDLERIDPGFPRAEVAPDVLSEDEMRDLAAMPAEEQAKWFFQLWTLKEALLKAAGFGFGMDPSKIRIRLNGPPAVISAPADFNGASLQQFSLGEGYASAFAMLGRVTALSIFSL